MSFSRDAYGANDATSDEGVMRLATRIKRYWREHGDYEVDVRLRRINFEKSARIAPLVIVSDMVNGLPQRALAEKTGGAR